MQLRIDQLSKQYSDSVKVLDRISLSVNQGRFVVIMGKSGSGKSTLLNLIGGLDRPTSGSIELGGTELTALSETGRTLFRRRHIGIVFQSYNLIPTLTVLENLCLPLTLLGQAPQPDLVRDRLASVQLQGKESCFPDRLSGGEQQRVAIARALIHEPDLILADEPTGNLDLHTAKEVLGLLDRTVRALGKTLVMATHSREVVGVADQIFEIRDGRLIEMVSTS
jgi:putative ABC transport system ATP-binding protein